MHARRFIALTVVALGWAPAAQAASLELGIVNTSDSPTTLGGNTSAGPELRVVNSDPSRPALRTDVDGGSAIGLLSLQNGSDATGAAVQGQSASTATTFSVYGLLTSATPGRGAAAVRGEVKGTNGNAYGVYGTHAGAGAGVFGTSVNGNGVAARHTATTGGGFASAAIFGQTLSTDPNAASIYGRLGAVDAGSTAAAVKGEETATGNTNGYGVAGIHDGPGTGVYGEGGKRGIYGYSLSGTGVSGQSFGNSTSAGVAGASPEGYGVYGDTVDGKAIYGLGRSGWAGYFDGAVKVNGDLTVTGTLTKGAGAFRIDHPLDPAHEYLQHSFVESPDMKDVYDGVVTTDRRGFATVTMPRWFEALNRTFRYQLTIVGTRGWNARVVKEMARNRFTIQSDEPRVKVSWQVTGVRHDAYANAHRIKVEVPKTAADR